MTRLAASGLLLATAFIVTLLLMEPLESPTGLVTYIGGTSSYFEESAQGLWSETRGENYARLMDALYANGNVTQVIDGKLWVPWFTTSTQCTEAQLHKGNSCDAGTIDFNNNCMVTDEFSQVGILIAMGEDAGRMQEFYNTLPAIESTNGAIPAWRVFRSGSTIEPCKDNVNGNCDTASDATARIIMALLTAAGNDAFAEDDRSNYRQLGVQLAAEMVEYEMDNTCRSSDLGYGNICYWLAAGSEAKRGGLASTDYGYTGYYGDAIIALLMACSVTENSSYCSIANNVTLNYLQAADWDGENFSVPPGRSFKWTNLGGVPQAECTNTCGPVQWDGADAPRALGMCLANYYADIINHTLPGLEDYCTQWGELHLDDPTKAPLQYEPDGSAGSAITGYFAQGLQALFHPGGHDPSLFEDSLDSALGHYSTATGTMDWTDCLGVYTSAFSIRALGVGLGRDAGAFPSALNTNQSNTTENGTGSNSTNETIVSNISMIVTPASPVIVAEPANVTFIANVTGGNYTIIWQKDGENVSTNDTYVFLGNYSAAGSYNITARAFGESNNVTALVALIITDTNETNQTNTTESNQTEQNETNQTEITENQTSNETQSNSTEESSQDNQTNQQTISTGGGGGGAAIPEEQEPAVVEEVIPSPRERITRLILTHFEDEEYQSLVAAVRNYYEEEP